MTTSAAEQAERIDQTETTDTADTAETPDSAEVADAADNSADATHSTRWFPLRRGNRLVTLCVVVAAVLAGFGAWCTVEASALRSSDSANNLALVDTATTTEVTAAVTSALNQVFSYSYENTERTKQAAAQVLRGQALDGYNALFAQVEKLAAEQKLVVSANVTGSAVQHLSDNSATLLVFLDQSAKRAANATPAVAAAQLSVTAEREGDNWVITELVPR